MGGGLIRYHGAGLFGVVSARLSSEVYSNWLTRFITVELRGVSAANVPAKPNYSDLLTCDMNGGKVMGANTDKSDKADAKRMRWLLDGNGYFMEEDMLCGHAPCSEEEQDECRAKIDIATEED